MRRRSQLVLGALMALTATSTFDNGPIENLIPEPEPEPFYPPAPPMPVYADDAGGNRKQRRKRDAEARRAARKRR